MDKELLLFQDESEDVILARIQEESLRYYNEVELPRRAAIDIQPVQQQYKPEFSTEPHCSKLPDSSHQTPVKDVFYKMSDDGAEGFHLAAGDTFVYPTNYPIRKYQKNIILSGLFHNTLVSLPTGLGKTFIAAVVMFNYYRWFPEGKIVFMAPTRPLVAQQIRACHDIMAIPVEDTIEMTGSMNPTDRSKHWKSKRVFFLTPQVMANDIRSGVCPTKFFKCVVIDEAHKATKEYAYCHVIKGLEEAGAVFRVLALSATPGSNIKAVIEVVQNLRISTLELRGEDSPDVIPYIHTKQIEPISLSLSKNIINIREQFLKIYDKYLKNLRESRFVTCNVQNLTKFQLLKLSEKMRSQRPPGITKERIGVLMSDFTVCMTLAHGLDLLQTYGLRAFYQYFTACEDEDNRKAAFTRLRQDVGFLQLMDSLHTYVSSPMDQFWSHPKHEQLVKILIEHYSESESTENCQTKVIIFCQYRVVVSEIYELLNKIHPLFKPVMFIGQGVGKDKTGLPQKKQMEIMKNFREGKSNVLIATCVAEEGLDIGSVDLLILMEVQRSPVRLVQRLGRTGRHRKGRCVVLLTQGREVQKFDEAMASRKTFLNNIQKSKLLIANLYKDDPRMIPPEFVPKMLLVHINVPERITPGKNIKQSTIRQTLLNTHLSDIVEEEESPFLSKEQLDCNKDELGTYQITFTSLPLTCSEYMYPKINDCAISMEELFRPSFCHLSEYNDWNRCLQPTYLLSHSSDSEMLCHLLKNAESMHLRDNTDEDVQVCLNSKSMNLNKPTKNKTKINKELGKKKNLEIEEKPNMDIRQCMAVRSNKVYNTQIKYYQQPVVLTETSVIEYDDQVQPSSNNVYNKENIMTNNKQASKHSCLFFKQTDGDMLSKLKNVAELADNKDISLTLSNISQINKLLKSFTKEIIININVSTLFTIDSKFHSNKSLLQKDKPSSYKINNLCSEKHNSLSTEVNKMYSLLETSPTKINTLENIDIPKEQNESNSEEYFNFDDIFSGDDKLCDFGKEKHMHKTSTPKEKIIDNYQLFNTLDRSKSRVNRLQCSILSNKEKCPSNNFLSKSNFISPKSKFNFQSADLSVSNIVLYGTDLMSPESPVLSGQILHSVTLKTQSKGRRSLFKNNDLDYDIDLPLSRKQPFYSSDIGMKKPSEGPNLSSTKLFHGEDVLDQSSMYTVTQLVESVTTSSKNSLKEHKDIHDLGSLNGTKETNVLFTNTRDDVQSKELDIPSIKDKITNHEDNMVPNLMVTNQIKMSFPNPGNNSVVDFNNMFTIEQNNFESNHPLSERKKVPNINQSANYRNQSINSEIAQTSTLHSDSEELFNVQSESDASSDVFICQKYNKKLKPKAKHEKVNENRKTKKNQFIEMEADVSGTAYSTDEEITSDLDDLEESFINDLTELPNSSVEPASDTQARYLQSVKYRLENPGGFKIPKLTNSVLAMDVYSQLVEEEEDENDTYVNDSFCCDATEIPTIQEPSLLDIAEEILKSKKRKKRRRIHLSSDSSANDDNSSIKNKNCKTDKSIYTVKSIAHLSTVKQNSLIKKTRVIHSDSDNDSDNTKTTHKNQFPINQSWNQVESSPDCSRLLNVNIKSKKRNHLLTSSDSDSDATL